MTTAKKRVNSCNKGKVGEREFAKHLRELGFEARRGEQHAGGPEAPDVVTSLDYIHFEVKFGYGGSDLDVTTKALQKAFEQAGKEAPPEKKPVVAWKVRGERFWRYTFLMEYMGAMVTACERESEREKILLERLNEIAL